MSIRVCVFCLYCYQKTIMRILKYFVQSGQKVNEEQENEEEENEVEQNRVISG